VTRNCEFDSDEVLSAAMREFRQHGYAGTSIKSLERATGLSSGSLYNSFGSKEEVFTRVLHHYNEVVVRKRIAEHLEAKRPAEGIRSLFLSLLDGPDAGSHGCLLTNSAVEFGAGESFFKSDVQDGLETLEKAFRAAIDQLLTTQGAAPNSVLAQAHASTPLKLLALYQGILVLLRSGRPNEQLRDLIDQEVSQLTGDKYD